MDFHIIIYPHGLIGNSPYLELSFMYISKIKPNYDFELIFDMKSKNLFVKSIKNIQIKSLNEQINFKEFYKNENLEKDGYIDNNGDLMINYTINYNESYDFLHDIKDYYEIYINKSFENINSYWELDIPKKVLEEKPKHKIEQKKLVNLLGIKTINPKKIIDDDENTEKEKEKEEEEEEEEENLNQKKVRKIRKKKNK